MIPEKELDTLIKWSERNEDLALELRKDAPKEVVELAKRFYWKPYDKVKGKNGEIISVKL